MPTSIALLIFARKFLRKSTIASLVFISENKMSNPSKNLVDGKNYLCKMLVIENFLSLLPKLI